MYNRMCNDVSQPLDGNGHLHDNSCVPILYYTLIVNNMFYIYSNIYLH